MITEFGLVQELKEFLFGLPNPLLKGSGWKKKISGRKGNKLHALYPSLYTPPSYLTLSFSHWLNKKERLGDGQGELGQLFDRLDFHK